MGWTVGVTAKGRKWYRNDETGVTTFDRPPDLKDDDSTTSVKSSPSGVVPHKPEPQCSRCKNSGHYTKDCPDLYVKQPSPVPSPRQSQPTPVQIPVILTHPPVVMGHPPVQPINSNLAAPHILPPAIPTISPVVPEHIEIHKSPEEKTASNIPSGQRLQQLRDRAFQLTQVLSSKDQVIQTKDKEIEQLQNLLYNTHSELHYWQTQEAGFIEKIEKSKNELANAQIRHQENLRLLQDKILESPNASNYHQRTFELVVQQERRVRQQWTEDRRPGRGLVSYNPEMQQQHQQTADWVAQQAAQAQGVYGYYQ